MIDNMFVVAILTTKNVEVKEEDKVMGVVDVMEPVTSPEVYGQMVKVMRRMRKAMYSSCTF